MPRKDINSITLNLILGGEVVSFVDDTKSMMRKNKRRVQ